MRVTRTLISALTGGRPAMGRAESVVQCSQKRRRCHRRTVLGDTMTRACLHPAHTFDNATQKRRFALLPLGPNTRLFLKVGLGGKDRVSMAAMRGISSTVGNQWR